MKLVITLEIDPGDMPADKLAARLRNRRGHVGENIPRAAARAAEEAAWVGFQDDAYRHPVVKRASSRIAR